MNERALVLIKPDGMQKRIVGDVINNFLAGDLKLVGIKLVKANPVIAKKHYALLKDQFFFKQIVSYLCGDLHGGEPVMVMVFKGKNAIAKCRAIAGATNPEEADPRSVRGKFGRITTKGVYENLVHVSSSVAEAKREISLWFKSSELLKEQE